MWKFVLVLALSLLHVVSIWRVDRLPRKVAFDQNVLSPIGITYADNYTGNLEDAFPVFYDRFTSVFKALDMTCNTSHSLRYEACTTAFKGLE